MKNDYYYNVYSIYSAQWLICVLYSAEGNIPMIMFNKCSSGVKAVMANGQW